jgi:hypothetical protein
VYSEGGRDRTASFDVPGATWPSCDVLVQYLAINLAAELLPLSMELAEQAAAKTRPPPPQQEAVPACAPSLDSRFSTWPEQLPALEKPSQAPPEPAERRAVAVRLGAAVWPELIVSGWGSLGVSAEVGARYRFVSLGVEAHGDPPIGSQSYPQVGTVSFARVSGALVLCGHLSWFVGCAVGDVGRFVFPNHIHELPASTFYGAVGVRAGLELPVVPPRLFLRVGVDLRAPIPPVRKAAGGVDVFASAGPGVGLGLGALFELAP